MQFVYNKFVSFPKNFDNYLLVKPWYFSKISYCLFIQDFVEIILQNTLEFRSCILLQIFKHKYKSKLLNPKFFDMDFDYDLELPEIYTLLEIENSDFEKAMYADIINDQENFIYLNTVLLNKNLN